MTIQDNPRLYRDSIAPLELSEVIARHATLGAIVPHESRSAKYSHVNSADVLQTLSGNGFTVHGVNRARTRKYQGFERHSVTLRHPDYKPRKVGDVVPQITFLNSHNGTSCAEFTAGLLRLVCLNGAVTGFNWATFKVSHTGADIQGRVIDAAFSVVSQFDRLLDRVEHYQGITLTREREREFGERALAIRYGDEAPINPLSILSARRVDDLGDDLWTVYNRVQENVIRGGLPGRIIGADGRARNTSTRAVTSINSGVAFNRALFDLTEEFANAA